MTFGGKKWRKTEKKVMFFEIERLCCLADCNRDPESVQTLHGLVGIKDPRRLPQILATKSIGKSTANGVEKDTLAASGLQITNPRSVADTLLKTFVRKAFPLRMVGHIGTRNIITISATTITTAFTRPASTTKCSRIPRGSRFLLGEVHQLDKWLKAKQLRNQPDCLGSSAVKI